MKNLRRGESIDQNPSDNNSFLLYYPIYTNTAHEKDQLLGWTSNVTYSAGLYLENSNSLILEIFKNELNLKTEIVKFFLKHRIRLKLSTLLEAKQSTDEFLKNTIKLNFISEHYILVEVKFKRIILIDFYTGKFSTIPHKTIAKGGKFTSLEILYTFDEFYNKIDPKNKKEEDSSYRNPPINQTVNSPNNQSTLRQNATKLNVKETKETVTSTMSNNSTIQEKKLTLQSNSSISIKNQLNNSTEGKIKAQYLRRTYIFISIKNTLYYLIVDNSYTPEKKMIFKKTIITVDEGELISEMNVIRIKKEDKFAFVIFILTKKNLSIIPTEFSKASLKAFLMNNNYNKLNYHCIKYEFNFGVSVDYHLIAKFNGQSKSDIYIATKDYLITIPINWFNLRTNFKLYGYANGIKQVINIPKLTTCIKKDYKIIKLNNCSYITEIEENEGNIIVYNKIHKSLEIYYQDNNRSEKVSNYKPVNLIKFVLFPKMHCIFFAMDNTFNKLSFNKKLYWYKEKWDLQGEELKKKKGNSFNLAEIKDKFNFICKNYNETQASHCVVCGKEGTNLIKCPIDKCNSFYCSEEHLNADYKAVHFFHCKLKEFFLHYTYKNQISFFNDLIIVIGDIIKLIFSFIEAKEHYLFYFPYVKILSTLFQTFNIKEISNTVFQLSSKSIQGEMLKELIFYQEMTFFYYNMILLYLNFAIKGGMYSFVEKEIENLGSEILFKKESFISTIFKKEFYTTQDEVFFANSKYFFIDKDYINSSLFLKQNNLLFINTIYLFSNFIHIIDKICKDKPPSNINLTEFDFTLKSQLLVLFEDRGMDNVTNYFYSYISPYICLNKKISNAEKFLKKVQTSLTIEFTPISIFNVVIDHNLGMIQFATRKYLDGIHNLESAYHLLCENQFSYPLRILIAERLSLAYLNIRELMKSHHLIKEAMELRSRFNTPENKMRRLHLSSCINYIKDFIEYEYQIKSERYNIKKRSKNHTFKIIDYTGGKFESRQRSLIDIYTKDYFEAAEFIYSLNDELINKLNNDNQSKKSTIINKEDINQPQHIHEIEKQKSNLSEYSTISNNNPIREIGEKEEILEFDNEIEIKENVFDQLIKNEKLTLNSINTQIITRNIVLRDFYGPISSFNINFHPLYTAEFKNIIDNSRHHFFLNKLTNYKMVELGNYFGQKEDDTCLDGLTRYLQQEEIQNMFKVEISKLVKKDDNYKSSYINETRNLKGNYRGEDQEKEKWMDKVKEGILRKKNRSLKEIDQAISSLYDNLNEEYKEEITKNPELILYYIFCDVETRDSETIQVYDGKRVKFAY